MRQAAVIIELSSAPSQLQLVGAGIIIAFALTWFGARRDGTSATEAVALLGLGAVAAVVGGRFWSLAAWWWSDPSTFELVLAPLEPAGYASGGALLGAAVVGLVARQVFGRDLWSLANVVVPAGFAALALARLGCVVERCDPGRASQTLGILYPDGARLHAFGAYIAIPVIIFVIYSFSRSFRPGARAAAVVFVYGLVRFCAEFARQAPSLFHFGHVIALACMIAGYLGWRSTIRKVEA